MGKKVRLWYVGGKSDKEYVAILKPGVGGFYAVQTFWGRRGSTLQNKDYSFPMASMALNFWHKKLQEKLMEGYTVQESNCSEYICSGGKLMFDARSGEWVSNEYLSPLERMTKKRSTPKQAKEEQILDGKVPSRRIDI